MKLSLIENAKESLRHGVDHFIEAKDDIESYKQAIINIHLGIELLLKEKLRRYNEWYLIDKYEFIHIRQLYEKYRRKKTVKRDPIKKTVQFTELLTRMAEFSSVVKNYKQYLVQLNDKRNQMVHYEIDIDTSEIDILIGKHILPFIDEYSKKELGLSSEKIFGKDKLKNIEVIIKAAEKPIIYNIKRKLLSAKTRYCKLPSSKKRERREKYKRHKEFLSKQRKDEVGDIYEVKCPACRSACLYHSPEYETEEALRPEKMFVARLECFMCELELVGIEAEEYYMQYTKGLTDEEYDKRVVNI